MAVFVFVFANPEEEIDGADAVIVDNLVGNN